MINQEPLKKFDKLYNDTYKDISLYIVCNCSNIKDVEDILQNTYFSVYKQLLKNIKINKSYILGIAKNKLKDYYRFRYKERLFKYFKKDNSEDFLEEIPSNFNLEKTISLKYDTEEVWKYLKKKNVIVSKVFYLFYYLDLSIKEISILLNITESNTKHYLYRTLKELSIYLERSNNNE